MEDDQRVEEWAKLIEAIGGLVTGLAWPIAVVLAVWLIMRRHNAAFGRLIDRVRSLQFPGGQIDLAEVVAEQQHQVDVLAEQVAAQGGDEPQRLEAARQLAEQAEELGKFRETMRVLDELALSVPIPWSAIDHLMTRLFGESTGDEGRLQREREIERRMRQIRTTQRNRENGPPGMGS